MQNNARSMSISIHRRTVDGESFTKDIERNVTLCCKGLGKTFKNRFCTGASLSIQITLGNLHGDWFTEDFDRQMKEGPGNGTSLMGALQGEPLGGFIYCGL